MFKAGQKVWHRDGKRSGTVLECDGDRVFIEQENGAELDFPAHELTATPPANAAPSAAAMAAAAAAPAGQPGYVMPERTLIMADITPEHLRVLAIIPARVLQAVAALYEKRPRAGRFSALDAARKLNVIMDVTGVPYRTMRAYSDRPGELGLMMGKGLADSQRAAG